MANKLADYLVDNELSDARRLAAQREKAHQDGRASMRHDILAILQRHGVGEEVMDEVGRVE